MNDLATVIENDIPEGRRHLQDSHVNLERVAEYCEANYFQCDGKKAALEETKNYTTQSLASVAYQINTLAYNMLQMLDLQMNQLADMESQMNHISQTVMIHKEKVARREIGVLTTNKSTSRQHKILAPANPERPIKYIRKPIDYSVLDEVGHGVRTQTNTPRAKRMPSGSGIPPAVAQQVGVPASTTSGPPPTTKPPTPPQPLRSGGSLSRGNREYRTPAPPIAPPQVPSNYAPNYPIGHPKSNIQDRSRGPGYSHLPAISPHLPAVSQPSQPIPPVHSIQAPQIGRVHPIQQSQNPVAVSTSAVPPHSPNPNTYPPPPPENMPEPPPPPPMPSSGSHGGEFDLPGNVTPPLPPPPQEHEEQFIQTQFMPPCPPNAGYPPGQENGPNPDYVPKNYTEKVVAIYDYVADKDDELSFLENSVIYVLKKNDDGWYEGMLGGITGLFPGNYVESCM
ncbi:Abl interactor 2 [Nymphon striatum]|nr:Abl interactor 2 [Nymphon striatum]